MIIIFTDISFLNFFIDILNETLGVYNNNNNNILNELNFFKFGEYFTIIGS